MLSTPLTPQLDIHFTKDIEPHNRQFLLYSTCAWFLRLMKTQLS